MRYCGIKAIALGRFDARVFLPILTNGAGGSGCGAHWFGGEPVVLIILHADHSFDTARLQHLDGNRCHDARPLNIDAATSLLASQHDTVEGNKTSGLMSTGSEHPRGGWA